MRVLATVFALALLAGCDSPSENDDESDDAIDQAATPRPVQIHEVVNLVEGAQQSWTFDIVAGAKQVEIRFFATGKAVVGAGLPFCFSWDTPTSSDSTGVCQGAGVGNIVVSPYFNDGEETLYDEGLDAAPGHYSFTLDAQQSATDFHAVVNVSYT